MIEQADDSKQKEDVDGAREAQPLHCSEAECTDDSETGVDRDAQNVRWMQDHWDLVPVAARLLAGPRVRVGGLPKQGRTALRICVKLRRTGVLKAEQREHSHDEQQNDEIECLRQAPQPQNKVATALCKQNRGSQE